MKDKLTFKALTVPNMLSLLRIILIPIFIYLYIDGERDLALGVLFLASITDLLDGLIARAFNQRSRIGYILDPLADKLLMDSTYILFTIRVLPLTIFVPKWLTITIVSRDIFMVIGVSLLTLMYPDRILKPHWLGKLTTTVQIIVAILILFANVTKIEMPGMLILFWITAGVTIISGFYYILREIGELE